MMFKKFMAVVLVMVLAMVLSPVAAQEDSTWSAYFFDSSTNSIFKVAPDGTVSNFSLNLATDEVVVSQPDINGDLVAFCTQTVAADAAPTIHFYLKDFVNGVDVMKLDLAYDSCYSGDAAFNEDGSLVAFGVGNYYSADVEQEWRLVVYDVASGALVHELTDLPEMPEFMGLPMPAPRFWDGDTLSFAVIMWASGGAPAYPAFTWNMTDGTVVEAPAQFGTFFTDYLPATGEWVMLAEDTTRAAGSPGGPMPSFNTVAVLNPDGTASEIFYSDVYIPMTVRFIEDGTAIAVQLLEAFDPNSADGGQSTKWIRIDRTGAITDLYGETSDFNRVEAIPGGHLHQEFKPNGDGVFANQVTLVINGSTQTVSLDVPQIVGFLGVH